MIKNKFHGFMPRVFWSFVGLMFLFALFFTLIVIYQQGKLLKEELVSKGLTSAGNLASSSRLGVFAGNPELIEPGIEKLLQQRSVLYAGAYDLEGKALIVKNKLIPLTMLFEGETEALSEELRERVRGGKGPFLIEKTIGKEKIVEFWAPVVVSRAFEDEDMLMDVGAGFGVSKEVLEVGSEIGKNMGLVRVGFSLSEIKTSLNNIVWMSIYIAALFIPIGFLFAYLLGKSVV